MNKSVGFLLNIYKNNCFLLLHFKGPAHLTDVLFNRFLSNIILSTSAVGTNTDSSSTGTFVLVILKYLSDVFYLSGLYYSFCICLCLYLTSINVVYVQLILAV